MKQSITSYLSGVPVYDAKQGIITLPGGFQLITTGLQAASVIPAGSAFVADEAARTAVLHKTVKLYASATNSATTLQVIKGSQFAVGDNIGKATGAKSIDITAIDRTSSALYDTITVSATLAYALNAGDTLVQTTNAGSSAVLVTPNGLTYNDVVVDTNVTITLAVGAVWYLRRVPAILAETQKLLTRSTFTNSK